MRVCTRQALLSELRYVIGAGYNPAGHMQKIAILYDASQAVLSTFDLDEVLQRILMIARDYFHLQNVAILLIDKDKQGLMHALPDWRGGGFRMRFA